MKKRMNLPSHSVGTPLEACFHPSAQRQLSYKSPSHTIFTFAENIKFHLHLCNGELSHTSIEGLGYNKVLFKGLKCYLEMIDEIFNSFHYSYDNLMSLNFCILNHGKGLPTREPTDIHHNKMVPNKPEISTHAILNMKRLGP